MDFVPESIAELGLDHAIIFTFSLHYLVYTANDRENNERLTLHYLLYSHQEADHPNTCTSTINSFSVQALPYAAWI